MLMPKRGLVVGMVTTIVLFIVECYYQYGVTTIVRGFQVTIGFILCNAFDIVMVLTY
jgi:hypothetical protein